jgi:diguanylate cyclase (GGDEF)-like protein
VSGLLNHLVNLTAYRDREVLDVTLAQLFNDLMHPRSVAIYRKVGEPDNLRWLTCASQGPDKSLASCSPSCENLEGLPPIATHPARCRALTGKNVFSQEDGFHVSAFPLNADREVVGVLELKTSDPLDERAQGIVSNILRVYQNFESVLDYSKRDSLTGLFNCKTFDQIFFKTMAGGSPPPSAELSIERRRATRDSYWLAMIDVDFFKAVNDSYGHLIGDEVLLLLSRIMRSSFRCGDRIYRFGGEEFTVMVRCNTATDAARVFERLRTNTEVYVFPQVRHLTVNIGFTEMRRGDSPNAALDRADRAVYFVKQNGRNHVRDYAALASCGAVENSEKVGEIELF